MRQFFLTSILIIGLTCNALSAQPLPNITADGAYLVETTTNTVLYAKNGQLTFYPASTTKVLTALTIADDLPMQKIITKSQASVQEVPSDSSHIGLRAGDQYTVYDGLHAVLMSSDNFVSYDLALADAGSISAFATRMNRLAQDAGALHSHFVNPHGYHHADHYTTPQDLAKITDAAFHNDTVEKIASTKNFNFSVINTGEQIPLKHTSALIDTTSSYYNPHVTATKTGYHTPAGRCLVAKAIYGPMHLIGVVMRTETPYQFQDMNQLFNYAADNFYYNEETGTLKNCSYSKDHELMINQALEKGWPIESNKNYMSPSTWYDFLNILGHALPHYPYAQNFPLTSIYYQQFMTKEQLATFIYEFLTQQLELVSITPQTLISDIDTLSTTTQTAIYFAVQSGLMPLSNNQFLPNHTVTLEEAIGVILQISRLVEHYDNFSVF